MQHALGKTQLIGRLHMLFIRCSSETSRRIRLDGLYLESSASLLIIEIMKIENLKKQRPFFVEYSIFNF